MSALCAGTPARKLDTRRPADSQSHAAGKQGCGRFVDVVGIPAVPSADPKARPLFARSAPVVICPHCDGPGDTVPPDED